MMWVLALRIFVYCVVVQLPKAKETSAVSGAGFMRLVKNVGDSISKMTSKMSESDEVSNRLATNSTSMLFCLVV